MRTESDLFIKKDFGYIDSNITAAIGAITELVYERVRRMTWRRGKQLGEPLVARESQSDIAEALGVSRKTVNGGIAVLEHIGWLRVEGQREQIRYVLGTYPDTFFADEKCLKVWAGLEELAASQGLAHIRELPGELRTKFAKAVLGVPEKERDRFYTTPEWISIRKEILSQQGQECTRCGSEEGLCVDHVVPRNTRPDLALEPSNLQVLCRSCNSKKRSKTTDYRKDVNAA